jgi:hypothetical protein
MNRRDMLRGAEVVAGAAAVNAVAQNSSNVTPTIHKCKIIITGGHPGDPEYGCGGTVARFTALGHDVVLLYMRSVCRLRPLMVRQRVGQPHWSQSSLRIHLFRCNRRRDQDGLVCISGIVE